jgi:hypothetical protein
MRLQKTGILSNAPTQQEEVESLGSLDLGPSVAAIAWHVRQATKEAIEAGQGLPYGPSRYRQTPHPWDMAEKNPQPKSEVSPGFFGGF